MSERDQQLLEAAIDRMGWPEIHAFREEIRKGQDIHEDAGGFLLRAVKSLFGIIQRDTVNNYRAAMISLVEEAKRNGIV